MLKEYHIELDYGEDHIQLPLPMDGRLLSRMLAYFYDSKKKGSDPSLVDLAWVLAAGSNSYRIGRYARRSVIKHSHVQDVTILVAHAQPLRT